MYDPRPHRIRKPSKWGILVAALCTPICWAIPIVGWVAVIIGWYLIVKQYFQAVSDEKVPLGFFKGEKNSQYPETFEEAPKGMSIFKD
jgi:hypothetical protein